MSKGYIVRIKVAIGNIDTMEYGVPVKARNENAAAAKGVKWALTREKVAPRDIKRIRVERS